MFEAFARPVRHASCSTICLAAGLAEIFAQCGALEKLLRVETETLLLQFIEDGNPCQESGEPACLIETTCAGNRR
jgi:hypothetical protein